MDGPSLASRLSDLTSEAEYLANTIYLNEDIPAERTRRHTHRLREILGVALVLSERLARKNGNGKMVQFSERPDGTGEASFEVNLNDLDPLD